MNGKCVANNRSIGYLGEDIACNFLLKCGYKILGRNIYFSTGEIDIVALDDDCLVFVEVKLRSNCKYGGSICAISDKKITNLRDLAFRYLEDNCGFLKNSFRIDAILIDIHTKNSGCINHFKNIR